MKVEHTARGFALINFTDSYGAKCSVQKSSLATDDAIWFGVDDAAPRIMAVEARDHGLDPGNQSTGWVPFPIPKDVLLTTRMHLTRKQVAELIPVLQRFVETGEVTDE